MANGHPDAMNYSLRQVEAHIWLHDRRTKQENARSLQIAFMARTSKSAEVNKKVKEWTK